MGAHCEKRPLPTLLCVVRPSWWSLDGCCRTYKASFHAAGAPGAPDLRPLAAVARESSSRVEQVSCGERISRCVSRATRRALIFGLTEGPPLQQIDNYRQHGARRCRWHLSDTTQHCWDRLAVHLQVRWRATEEDSSEHERCCLAGGSAQSATRNDAYNSRRGHPVAGSCVGVSVVSAFYGVCVC